MLLGVAAACDSPLDYSLSVSPREPGDRPRHVPAPVTYIDGEPRTSLVIQYASADEAIGDTHVIELRHGDQVVRSITITVSDRTCFGPLSEVTRYGLHYCSYDSGDLRLFSASAFADHGSCIGDVFCIPVCSPQHATSSCAEPLRCTSLITSIEPLASHLGCAPVGSRQLGDSCTLTAGEDGTSYDDCGRGLLCVDGTCHALCGFGLPPCDPCEYVAGHAPEVRVCR